MATSHSSHVEISGIDVQVNRKEIKNLHLSVLPPEGKVRLSVPFNTSEQAIRLAIINKLGWIKKQQRDFQAQPRQSSRQMSSGESHYLWGRPYRLEVAQTSGKHTVTVKGHAKIELGVAKNTSIENRLKLLNGLYRQQLQDSITKLLPLWQQKLKVEADSVSIKKMKTKWGSCNIVAKKLWLNLELAKKPPECMEYILVHELVHLIERHHNERFRHIMDKQLPDWQERRNLLNSLPLAYEDWHY